MLDGTCVRKNSDIDETLDRPVQNGDRRHRFVSAKAAAGKRISQSGAAPDDRRSLGKFVIAAPRLKSFLVQRNGMIVRCVARGRISSVICIVVDYGTKSGRRRGTVIDIFARNNAIFRPSKSCLKAAACGKPGDGSVESRSRWSKWKTTYLYFRPAPFCFFLWHIVAARWQGKCGRESKTADKDNAQKPDCHDTPREGREGLNERIITVL